jgi:lysophospholipase L1-like esterase
MNRMSGAAYLEPCLKSHQPLDVVVLLLGTNDLKSRYGAAPAEIARGVGRLVEIVYKCDTRHGGRTPDVILCAPPPIEEVGVFAEEFAGAAMRSRRLAEYLIQIAREYDCPFLDAGAVARSSAIDGIHWERDSHAKFAKAVASAVGEMKDKGIRGHP